MGMFGRNKIKPLGKMLTPEAVLAGGYPVPGIIGGYGGGTFNMDGSMATPVQRGYPSPNMNGLPMGPLGDGQTMEEATTLGETTHRPSLTGGYASPNIDGSAMTFEGVQPRNPQKGGNGFFSKNGAWRDVLGAIGDGLSGNPLYANTKLKREQMAHENAKLLQNRQWDVQDRDFKASQPDYFTVGRDRIKLDPRTGQAQVVYNGPEDFDEYAQAFGLQPGTDEYEQAITDYVLRGHGPTALGYDKELDDYRTTNDKSLEALRASNRLRIRGTPNYRDKNPLPLRPRAAPRTAAAPAKTATNPKTGEVVTLNSRGQWVDKNGKPVK